MTTVQIERRKRGFFGWIFLIAFMLFNAFMLFSCISGVASVSSHYDSAASDAEKAGAAIGTTIGMGMLLGIWMAGAVILGIFVLLTRGPKVIETVGETTDGSTSGPASGMTTISPSKKQFPWWGWAIGGVAALALVSALFGQQSDQRPPAANNGSNNVTTVATTSDAVSAPQTTPSNWSYDSSRDEMRNATDRFATVVSINREDLGFPYEDAQMSIILRNSAQYGRDIILSMHDGQFTCRFDGCSVHAKFDDGPIQTFSVNESDSGRGDTLFIVNQSRFLAQLRAAHRVVIEAQFFNRGAEQFTFEVEGLEWQ